MEKKVEVVVVGMEVVVAVAARRTCTSCSTSNASSLSPIPSRHCTACERIRSSANFASRSSSAAAGRSGCH